MPDGVLKKKRPGRRRDPVSLDTLTPDQVMAALLKVKLSEVKKLEAEEKKAKDKPGGK